MPRTTHKAATAVIESIPTASGTSLVVNVYRPSLVRRLLGLVWRLVGLGLRLFGLGLTATGAAHFAVPERFDKLTALAFPTDTRQWTLRNGGTEVALGLAVFARRTRALGILGVLGYLAFLAKSALDADQ